MINLTPALFNAYISYQTQAISAFLPIISTVVGVFLAFAIANSVRFLILKSLKK